MSNTQPAFLPFPFCNNGKSGIDYTLPPIDNADTSVVSVAQAFSNIYQQPEDAGGLAPRRQDFNGIFNLMSQFLVFLNNGGVFQFDANNTNGYAKNSILWCGTVANTVYNRFLISLKDNNTANYLQNPNFINDGVNWQYAELSSIENKNGVLSFNQRPNFAGSQGATLADISGLGVVNFLGQGSIGANNQGSGRDMTMCCSLSIYAFTTSNQITVTIVYNYSLQNTGSANTINSMTNTGFSSVTSSNTLPIGKFANLNTLIANTKLTFADVLNHNNFTKKTVQGSNTFISFDRNSTLSYQASCITNDVTGQVASYISFSMPYSL